MIKYKGDITSIDNLTDALELFSRHGIFVKITNKAKTNPYGDKLQKAFFKEKSKWIIIPILMTLILIISCCL